MAKFKAAVNEKAVVLLLMVSPVVYWGLVFGLCFVMMYLVAILDLLSS